MSKTMVKNSETWICIAHNYTETSFSAMSYHLAHFLAKKGYNILFISHYPHFEKPFEIKVGKCTILVHSWPFGKRPVNLRSFLWFGRIYLKYRPKVVIGHFVGSNITVVVSKILSNFKANTFVYYHTLSNANKLDSNHSKIKQLLTIKRKKIFYNLFCDEIICPSNLGKEDYLHVYGKRKDENKCKVVLNPMIDRFQSNNQSSKKGDEIIISYLGRLDPCKGLEELISAFKQYSKKKSTKLKLRIAGDGALIEKIIQSIKGDTRISYYGKISYDKVDAYIRDSDYMIIPSLYDNLPTVGLESLMNGVPLLLSRKTGLAEYLEDSKEGYLFDPTENDMIQIFNKVEESEPDLFLFSKNARKTFIEKFSINDYCEKMVSVLEDLPPRE